MYTLDLNTGIVTRDADGKQVAPVDDINDVDYVAYVNWVNNGNSPTEIQPPIPEKRCITKLAFRYRFTTEERVAIEYAATSQPDDTDEMGLFRAALRVYLDDLDSANYVDLNSPTMVDALNKLVYFKLLTEDRKNEILSHPISTSEMCDQ